MDSEQQAGKVLEVAAGRWRSYTGPRTVTIDSLTLVKGSGERWVNIATAPLALPVPR
jgi:hypothetical protein